MNEARAIVERYLRDAVNGDCDSASALIADESLLQELTSFRRAFPDLTSRVNLMVAQDDVVGVNLSGHGTHLGMFQGIPPTGRAWTTTCSAFFRVDGGRVSDAWVNWNLLSILEQLGAIRRIGSGSA